jgi:two-component system response regulator FixJ
MSSDPIVFVVDDDPAMRDSLKLLLESSGFTTHTYESAVAFLASDAVGGFGCVVADIRMPEMDGLQLQEQLGSRRSVLPVILMTGHGDIPIAVRAMKAGAVDFLEKPFDDEALLGSVRRALEQAKASGAAEADAKLVQERLSSLTERERQVLDLLVAGKPNKIVAYELSISPRTVEIHRARVMDKMEAKSLAELVRMKVSIASK